ncbi:transcriptional regulator [bacterium]|nr:MAG: transcriptional regulator [bacterium]
MNASLPKRPAAPEETTWIRHPESSPCPVETTLRIVGGKWKAVILFRLVEGKKRFSELKRLLPGATQQMLTQQLRELERDGIVHREVYAEVPPRVEYSLTELGRTLEPVLNLMSDWGQAYRDQNGTIADEARPEALQ